MTSDIRLNCLVWGDYPDLRTFSVEVKNTYNIDKLRDLIKGKKRQTFIETDANKLVLWKVNIPLYQQNDTLTALQSNPWANIKDTLEGSVMGVLNDISEYFEISPPKKNIHIIVECRN